MGNLPKGVLCIWSICIVSLLVSCARTTGLATQSIGDPQQTSVNSITTSVPTSTTHHNITVWLDSTRMDGAEIYRKLFPDKADKIDFQIVDRSQFPAMILRFNQQGTGWPDVVFAEPELVAQTMDSQHDYPLDLENLVSAEMLGNFEERANDACTFGGMLLCLRHDTAPMVLYYNKPLMNEFGYQVPTTWQEYQALGERIGNEHPGFIIGSFGDAWGFKAYFDASGCPYSWVLDEKTVTINLTDDRCVRAVKMVDTLLANKTLAPYGYFDSHFNQIAQNNKLIMLVGPSWMALASFGGKPGSQYYNNANHQLGVAAPLRWEGEAQSMTSAMGGGAWVVSKHTQNVDLALDFITWIISAPEFWAITPDYPVYVPVQPVWEEAVSTNPLFAEDPFPAIQAASEVISPLYKVPNYDVMGVLNDFVSVALHQKKSIESLLPDLQTAMTACAQTARYKVNTVSK